MVICVPGSPIDCAVTIPAASYGSIDALVISPAASAITASACFFVNFFFPLLWTTAVKSLSILGVNLEFPAASTASERDLYTGSSDRGSTNDSIFLSWSYSDKSAAVLTLRVLAPLFRRTLVLGPAPSSASCIPFFVPARIFS